MFFPKLSKLKAIENVEFLFKIKWLTWLKLCLFVPCSTMEVKSKLTKLKIFENELRLFKEELRKVN